jgi:hypothetical protein
MVRARMIARATLVGVALVSIGIPASAQSGGGGVPICRKLLIPGSDASPVTLDPPCGVYGDCAVWATEPTPDSCLTVSYQTNVFKCGSQVSWQGWTIFYVGGTCVNGVCVADETTQEDHRDQTFVLRYVGTVYCTNP